jgi:L-iditol 2-dehydrogenase
MEELSMTEPACVAQHAVRRANVTAGQTVVIFGAGPIGILAARWVKIFGAEPILVDISPEKVAFAREKGFRVVNSREENVIEAVKKYNGGRLADAAIEGTGAGVVLSSCIECVRAKGTIALLGNPAGETKIPQKLHSMMLRKEVDVHGVWNSSRAPYPVNEWKFTVRMMDEGVLKTADLITDRLSLEELPQAMAEIKSGTRKIVKAVSVCGR